MFFQAPRSMDDLHSWLLEKQVYYTFDEDEILNGHWSKGLETIYANGIVCESWTIRLNVTVNDKSEILTHTVDKTGVCL